MASAKRGDKPCEDCGVLLVNVVSTRKYCYECAKKRQRANKKQYNTVKQKKTKNKLLTPIVNHNAKYCKGCIYWGGGFSDTKCCNYIFMNDHSRPCPPGKDCTEKVLKKRRG